MFRKFLILILLLMGALLYEVVLEFGDAFKESLKSTARATSSKPHTYHAVHTASGVYKGNDERDR